MTKVLAIVNGQMTEIISSYTHEQNVPSTVWTINHPLGKFPSVTVVDSGGTQTEGSVTYPSSSQIVITFGAGFSGTAYLN